MGIGFRGGNVQRCWCGQPASAGAGTYAGLAYIFVIIPSAVLYHSPFFFSLSTLLCIVVPYVIPQSRTIAVLAAAWAALTAACAVCVVEDNYDYLGGDLRAVLNVMSAQACNDLCVQDAACKSWTWGKKPGTDPSPLGRVLLPEPF